MFESESWEEIRWVLRWSWNCSKSLKTGDGEHWLQRSGINEWWSGDDDNEVGLLRFKWGDISLGRFGDKGGDECDSFGVKFVREGAEKSVLEWRFDTKGGGKSGDQFGKFAW